MNCKVNEELQRNAENRLKNLLEVAVFLGPISPNNDPDQVPQWYNKELLQRGQFLARKYYVSFNCAHLAGLLLGIQLPLALVPLLNTGRSRTVSKLFIRYQSTMLRVKQWYEGDPFDPNSEAFKSFRTVRKMHTNISSLMNDREKRVSGKNRVWISQCEMSLTIWAFMGMLILFPKECGYHSRSKEDLEAVIHMWRVFAYINGVDDRFNICDGNYEQTFALFTLILNNIFKKLVVQCPDSVGIDMSKGIVKALRPITPMLRWPVFMTYWYDILQIPHTIELNRWPLKARRHEQRIILTKLLKYDAWHYILGGLLKLNVRYQYLKKNRNERNLCCKYANLTYEASCVYDLDALQQ